MILYKYFSPNSNSFKSIINAGLWCDKYLNMNDPFESLAIVQRTYTKEQIEEFKAGAKQHEDPTFNELANLSDDTICEFMNTIRQDLLDTSYFFASLSETYDNILLWSHYALSHTGFVLAIEIDEKDSHVQKVCYQNNLPAFDMSWYFKVKNEDTTNSDEISYLLKDFAIKSEHWSYENEWRVARKDRGYRRYLPEDLKAVYFGINCDPEIEKVVLVLLSIVNEDIPIYKMDLTKSPLGMTVKDYELDK